jgi:DNA (cytosine-5)-methyltransferase 1
MTDTGNITRPLSVIDLFSGAGGFSLGFHEAGWFDCVLALDTDRDCTETFATNFPSADIMHADVRDIDPSGLAADVIVGGPPCQGFSRLNRGRAGDSRNALSLEIVRWTKVIAPSAVAIENVPAFLRSEAGYKLQVGLRGLGYLVRAGIVDAADFGVPQHRKRALVLAVRGRTSVWPRPTHDGRPEGSLRSHRTVADAFSLLPTLPDERNWHREHVSSAQARQRYRAVRQGGDRRDLPSDLTLRCWRGASGFSDVMGRLHWHKPSITVRTEFFRPEKGRFLHPTADRPITVREAARLQSFPDTFVFPETQTITSVARQIGNAIPPRLARAVALSLLESLDHKLGTLAPEGRESS